MNTLSRIRAAFPALSGCDPRTLAPLTLAYIGDTVYDLYVRAYLIHEQPRTPNALHVAAAGRVCAAGQAAAYRRVQDALHEDEQAVFRRGRNAHSGTLPKHASVSDYRTATGLEALIGYLFLSGEDARIAELMRILIGEEANGV